MPKTAKTAQPYEWDYDGSWIPTATRWNSSAKTFSVGIFQWIPKKSGQGLKRDKVIKRIKGCMSNPYDVFQRAQEECDKLNQKNQ